LVFGFTGCSIGFLAEIVLKSIIEHPACSGSGLQEIVYVETSDGVFEPGQTARNRDEIAIGSSRSACCDLRDFPGRF